jgi:hypothetical protein
MSSIPMPLSLEHLAMAVNGTKDPVARRTLISIWTCQPAGFLAVHTGQQRIRLHESALPQPINDASSRNLIPQSSNNLALLCKRLTAESRLNVPTLRCTHTALIPFVARITVPRRPTTQFVSVRDAA